jgi:hypothetical protein
MSKENVQTVTLCPKCRKRGSLVVRAVTNGKTAKRYYHHYFGHHANSKSLVWHYVSESRVAKLQRFEVRLVPINESKSPAKPTLNPRFWK